ncbi:MAG: dCTP deaminase [Nanobdellota archaeon]
MIRNFKKENIGPCTYDFRLNKIYQHTGMDVVDLSKNQVPEIRELALPYIIAPGEFILASTMEEFDTPLDLMSIYSMKSTAFRIGLNILCGLNDPGYKGAAVFGIQNISNNRIKLYQGMELLQTAFVELKGNPIPIETRYMGGRIL